MFDVRSLSFQPGRLWHLVCVGASINDPGDVITKFFADIAQSLDATAIFHGVMEQRTGRFSLIRAVLKCDGSHAKNVRHERNSRFLAHLITMGVRCINQGFLKLLRQLHSGA